METKAIDEESQKSFTEREIEQLKANFLRAAALTDSKPTGSLRGKPVLDLESFTVCVGLPSCGSFLTALFAYFSRCEKENENRSMSSALDRNRFMTQEQFLTCMSTLVHGNKTEKLRMVFEMCDADKDGSIVHDELREMLHAMNQVMTLSDEGPIITEQQVNQIMRFLDCNSDGKVEWNEFREAVCRRSSILAHFYSPPATTRQRFQAILAIGTKLETSLHAMGLQPEEFIEVEVEEGEGQNHHGRAIGVGAGAKTNDLPPGLGTRKILLHDIWEKHRSKEHGGRSFFMNKRTRAVSWDLPEDTEYDQWIESTNGLDDKTGRKYYFNVRTKNSFWGIRRNSDESVVDGDENEEVENSEVKKTKSGKLSYEKELAKKDLQIAQLKAEKYAMRLEVQRSHVLSLRLLLTAQQLHAELSGTLEDLEESIDPNSEQELHDLEKLTTSLYDKNHSPNIREEEALEREKIRLQSMRERLEKGEIVWEPLVPDSPIQTLRKKGSEELLHILPPKPLTKSNIVEKSGKHFSPRRFDAMNLKSTGTRGSLPISPLSKQNFQSRAKINSVEKAGDDVSVTEAIMQHSGQDREIIAFGDRRWDDALNVMRGIQISASRAASEGMRPIRDYHFASSDRYRLESIGNDYETSKEKLSESQKEFSHAANLSTVKSRQFKLKQNQHKASALKRFGTMSDMSNFVCTFVDYAPRIFNSLRRMWGISTKTYLKSIGFDNMVRHLMSGSLETMTGAPTKAGSKSFFFYSYDSKFLVKTIPLAEKEAIFDIAISMNPNSEDTNPKSNAKRNLLLKSKISDSNVPKTWLRRYYEHMKKNPNSLLCRFCGLHMMMYGSSGTPQYFIVMVSGFPSSPLPHRIFDLKGSSHNRKNQKTQFWYRGNEPDRACPLRNTVMKDIDFLELGCKLDIDEEPRKLLLESLELDSALLKSFHIMDYSCLVAITYKTPIKTRSGMKLTPGHFAALAASRRAPSMKPPESLSNDSKTAFFPPQIFQEECIILEKNENQENGNNGFLKKKSVHQKASIFSGAKSRYFVHRNGFLFYYNCKEIPKHTDLPDSCFSLAKVKNVVVTGKELELIFDGY
eukprot:g877.t1